MATFLTDVIDELGDLTQTVEVEEVWGCGREL